MQTKVDESVSLVRNSLPSRINLLLEFLRIVIRSNSLVSALNTNAYIEVWNHARGVAFAAPTRYQSKNGSDSSYEVSPCDVVDATVLSGFYSTVIDPLTRSRRVWPEVPSVFEPNLLAPVPGFSAGCTPLDGVLESTLTCLSDLSCLQMLSHYFPNLNEVCVTHIVVSAVL